MKVVSPGRNGLSPACGSQAGIVADRTACTLPLMESCTSRVTASAPKFASEAKTSTSCGCSYDLLAFIAVIPTLSWAAPIRWKISSSASTTTPSRSLIRPSLKSTSCADSPAGSSVPSAPEDWAKARATVTASPNREIPSPGSMASMRAMSCRLSEVKLHTTPARWSKAITIA